jgi:calmodulin
MASNLTDDELAELREIFSHYDENENGTMEARELGALLEALGAELDQEQVASAMRDLDTDGNGTIELEEFIAWWTDH